MLANGLMSHNLGRGWRLDTCDNKELREHNEILNWFLDIPGSEYPFSIHNLCRIGMVSGKKPGDWYGPSQVSFVLRFVCLLLLFVVCCCLPVVCCCLLLFTCFSL